MSEYKKKFYDIYDGSFYVSEKKKTCTECNTPNVSTITFIAEENGGELFEVFVCENCLLKALEKLREVE